MIRSRERSRLWWRRGEGQTWRKEGGKGMEEMRLSGAVRLNWRNDLREASLILETDEKNVLESKEEKYIYRRSRGRRRRSSIGVSGNRRGEKDEQKN